MKQAIYFLTLTLLLLSCNNRTRKPIDVKSVDTLQTISPDQRLSEIYIKDKSKYDQTFIDGLSGYNGPIYLIDNFIIIGKDTTYFPDAFPIGKSVAFKETKAGDNYWLTVTRTNMTNLTYNFKITDKANKIKDTKSGKSVLGSLFFLAAEMDNDSQTGDGYSSYEYWDKTKDCWLSIRIGYDKDKDGKQRAMITYGCEDRNKQSLKLDECPTLRTE